MAQCDAITRGLSLRLVEDPRCVRDGSGGIYPVSCVPQRLNSSIIYDRDFSYNFFGFKVRPEP